MLFYLQVGCQRSVCITTVKGLGIPLFAFFEGWRFPQFFLSNGNLCHCQLLWRQFSTVISGLHVAEHHLERRAVTDDVVNIQKEVVVLIIV